MTEKRRKKLEALIDAIRLEPCLQKEETRNGCCTYIGVTHGETYTLLSPAYISEVTTCVSGF